MTGQALQYRLLMNILQKHFSSQQIHEFKFFLQITIEFLGKKLFHNNNHEDSIPA